jgi:hypothetical protein
MIWRSRSRANRPRGPLGEAPGRAGWCNSDSGPGAPPDEMPRFSSHPGNTGGGSDDLALDMVFDRVPPPLNASPQLAALHQVLADLSGPAEPGELAVEAAVLARFRSRVLPAAVSPAGPAPAPRTSPWTRFAPHSRRLAAGLVAAVIVAGGTAAAYAGALPRPVQDFAHRMIDAPAGRHPSGQQSGVVPRHQPGTTPAGTASPRQAPHSAAPGSAGAHTQPGRDGHPSGSAHSAQPRPSAEPSAHSGRSSHTVPPQASRPPNGSHSPHPNHGHGQSRPSQASRAHRQNLPSQASRAHRQNRPRQASAPGRTSTRPHSAKRPRAPGSRGEVPARRSTGASRRSQ